jgi:hypothetical protein
LTASPLDSNEGVEEAKKLEALFDAKCVRPSRAVLASPS